MPLQVNTTSCLLVILCLQVASHLDNPLVAQETVPVAHPLRLAGPAQRPTNVSGDASVATDAPREPRYRVSKLSTSRSTRVARLDDQPPVTPAPLEIVEPSREPSSLLDRPAQLPSIEDTAGPAAGEDEDSLTPLQNRDMSLKVSAVNIAVAGLGTGILPDDAYDRQASEQFALPDGYARGAAFQCVHWRPSNICHYPLYFEDAMLERHGHQRFGTLQPLASGVKFFTTLSLIPYLATLQPACEPRYALGHFRAGSRAPRLRDSLPWDRRAAVVESLSVASFFWAAPL